MFVCVSLMRAVCPHLVLFTRLNEIFACLLAAMTPGTLDTS